MESDNKGVVPNFTKENLPDYFCAVPFASLIFNPTGLVGSCRELGSRHSVGNAKTQTWKEIWNGEAMRSWRREFLTGEIKTCAKFIKHRQCQKEPFNQALLPYIELSEVQTRGPSRVSPDFNGKCNLKCPMCEIWKDPNGLYDELGFWESAEKEIFPHLVQVDPLAGEPFIQKDTYRLLEIMGRVNPSAVWKVTTNGQWKLTPFIKQRLDGVNLSTLNFSVDSLVPETYESIRVGGILKDVLQNIEDVRVYREERLKKTGKTFGLMINTLIQIQNWREVGDFVKYALARGAYPFIQFLNVPSDRSLLSLKLNKRIEILEFYSRTIPKHHLKEYCERVWRPLVQSLPQRVPRYPQNPELLP